MDFNWELIISSLAIVVSVFAIYTQRKHNRLSFKPIPVVVKYNYLDVLRVRLWNKGTGPFIIKNFDVKGENSLIDIMPRETMDYVYVEYIDNLVDRAISPNDTLNLLEFKKRTNDNGDVIEGYERIFEMIKETLNGKEIYIEYEDIYGNKMDYLSEKLDFGEVYDEEKYIN